MIKRFSKAVLSIVLLSSILCPFVGTFTSSHLISNQSDSFSSHQTDLSVVAENDYSDPFSLPFSVLPGEEWELEEEDTKRKKRSFQGYYINREHILHLVNAPPFTYIATYTLYPDFSPLYLLFEVFRI